MKKNSEKQRDLENKAPKNLSCIYEGPCISVYKEVMQIGSLQKITDLVYHPGAVVILPVNEKNEVLFIEQWRRGAEKILIELPAGRLEKNESPQERAKKELQEETGFDAKVFTPLGGFYTTPGFCNEYIHVFLAKDLFTSPLQADDTDLIDTRPIDFAKIPALISQGQLIDSKTLSALYLYQIYKAHHEK